MTNCRSNKTPLHSAGHECFPSSPFRDVNKPRTKQKKKRFSYDLWTLSSEQSAYSVGCEGHLFQWPLCSGSTTVKASPQKPWPASRASQTSPLSRLPAPKCSVGRPPQKRSLTLTCKCEHQRCWVCPETEHTLHNMTSYIIPAALWEAREEFLQLKKVTARRISPRSTATCPFPRLLLTCRCDDPWLLADAVLIVDVDERGPQSHHSFAFAHSAGAQVWKEAKKGESGFRCSSCPKWSK